MVRNWFVGLVIGCICACPAQAQLPDDASSNHDAQSESAPKRILGIVPNYRSSASLEQYTPITPKEKFAIARQDSFDRGTFILGVLLGGEAQLTNSTPSFSHPSLKRKTVQIERRVPPETSDYRGFQQR